VVETHTLESGLGDGMDTDKAGNSRAEPTTNP
jgi:hypothetical protein